MEIIYWILINVKRKYFIHTYLLNLLNGRESFYNFDRGQSSKDECYIIILYNIIIVLFNPYDVIIQITNTKRHMTHSVCRLQAGTYLEKGSRLPECVIYNKR